MTETFPCPGVRPPFSTKGEYRLRFCSQHVTSHPSRLPDVANIGFTVVKSHNAEQHPSRMTRGRRFSEDLRWTVIRAQDHGLDPAVTAAITGVSQRQIRRIRHCYNQTGNPQTFRAQWGVELRGRRSKLTVEHRRVSCECDHTLYRITNPYLKFVEAYVARDRSAYLDEIQAELRAHFDLQVSLSTIWRHLNTIGYTYKKVGMQEISQVDANGAILDQQGCTRTERRSSVAVPLSDERELST